MNFKITRIGLLTCFLILSASLSAQDPTFEWAKSIGGLQSDIGNDITTDDAGNVYQVGYFMASVDFKPGDAAARGARALRYSGDGQVRPDRDAPWSSYSHAQPQEGVSNSGL